MMSSSYVYLLKPKNNNINICKIGKSDRPNERITAVSSQRPVLGQLEIYGLIECESSSDALRKEKELHEMFYGDHHHGEWFNFNYQIENYFKRNLVKNIDDNLFESIYRKSHVDYRRTLINDKLDQIARTYSFYAFRYIPESRLNDYVRLVELTDEDPDEYGINLLPYIIYCILSKEKKDSSLLPGRWMDLESCLYERSTAIKITNICLNFIDKMDKSFPNKKLVIELMLNCIKTLYLESLSYNGKEIAIADLNQLFKMSSMEETLKKIDETLPANYIDENEYAFYKFDEEYFKNCSDKYNCKTLKEIENWIKNDDSFELTFDNCKLLSLNYLLEKYTTEEIPDDVLEGDYYGFPSFVEFKNMVLDKRLETLNQSNSKLQNFLKSVKSKLGKKAQKEADRLFQDLYLLPAS